MHRRTRRFAPLLASALLLGASPALHAQDMAVPAVDDAPTAALLLLQAGDQAAANPREAVRLLRTVLDDWGTRPVASERDPNLFTAAGRRAEAMLLANPALLAVFRREEEPVAREMLARGELERVVATRILTEAGLDAALELAGRALVRARFAEAAGTLARVAAHDRLAGRALVHQRAMTAIAAARRGDVPRARAALADAEAAAALPDAPADARQTAAAARTEVDRAASGAERAQGGGDLRAVEHARDARAAAPQAAPGGSSEGLGTWGEIWRAPLEGPALLPGLALRGPFGDARDPSMARSMAVPAADAVRVYADDGSGVRAFDRVSGRPIWSHSVEGGATSNPSLHFVAVGEGSVASTEFQNTALARSVGRVVLSDAATGRVRAEFALDVGETRTGLGPLAPIGEPIIVDGRVIVAARRTTTRQETATWLFAFDLRTPGAPAWAAVVATVGSVLQAGVRGIESPVLAGGSILLATGTGAVARFDAATGSVIWLRRFPVPIRDLRPRQDVWDLSTPAVGGGRVVAVTPDGARVVALDFETGEEIESVPTGPGTPLGSPRTLVALPGTPLVAAVGTSVVAFDPATLQRPVWRWPDDGGTQPFTGRVTASAVGPTSAPCLVVPAGGAVRVLDARSGTPVLRVDGGGTSILLRDQLVVADGLSLASYMPLEVAERLCRARLAEDASVDAALSLLQLGRQARRGGVAAEGAREAARRLGLAETGTGGGQARTIPADDPRYATCEDLLDQLVAADAAAFATGDDARDLEAALDAASAAIGRLSRAQLARADRLLRRADAAGAAQVLLELLEARTPEGLVVVRDVTAARDVHALERLTRAAAEDPGARRAVMERVRRAAKDASADAGVLRTMARAATAVGDAEGATAAIAALRAVDARAAERLELECRAPANDAPVDLAGAPTRAVEFPGRLCALARAVRAPRDRVLTMQGTQFIPRRPPEFAPEWRAEIGTPEPIVVGVGDRIILWDERAAGQGEAVALDARTGAALWRSPHTDLVLGPLGWGADEPDPAITLAGGRTAPLAQALPALCRSSLVLTRRDGAMGALDPTDGVTVLWTRGGGGVAVAEFASDECTVVAGGASGEGEGVPRVVAVDAATGATVLEFDVGDGLAPTLQWMRLLPGGLLVVGTDEGVQARRLAGGDEMAPAWSVDAADVQASEAAWQAGRWLLVLGRFGQLVALDPRTGRVDAAAFRSSDLSTEPVRGVESGPNWVAVIRESTVEFFDMDGRFLGRDAAVGNRTIAIAFAARTQLVALDVSFERAGPLGAQQFGVEIFRLDPLRGGKALGEPVSMRSVGQRISAARAVDGWVLLSNGAFVQAVDFRQTGPEGR
jgi:outer membrane protein assembly factor BamB